MRKTAFVLVLVLALSSLAATTQASVSLSSKLPKQVRKQLSLAMSATARYRSVE